MTALPDQDLTAAELDSAEYHASSGTNTPVLGRDAMLRMAREVRRRRALDERQALDKAVADSAIARTMALRAIEDARVRYRNTSSDQSWALLKSRSSAYNELTRVLQAAVDRAIAFRDTQAHERITTALSELPDVEMPADITERVMLAVADVEATLRDPPPTGDVIGPGAKDPIRKP